MYSPLRSRSVCWADIVSACPHDRPFRTRETCAPKPHRKCAASEEDQIRSIPVGVLWRASVQPDVLVLEGQALDAAGGPGQPVSDLARLCHRALQAGHVAAVFLEIGRAHV